MLVNFPQNFSFGDVTPTQFGLKLCNILYYNLLFKDLKCFFEMF